VYAVNGQDLNVVDIWPRPPLSADSLTLQVGFGVTGLVARTGKTGADRGRLTPQLCCTVSCFSSSDSRPWPGCASRSPGLEGDVVGVLAAHRDPAPSVRPGRPRHRGNRTPRSSGLRLDAEQLWRTVNRQRTERDRLIKAAIAAQEAERRRNRLRAARRPSPPALRIHVVPPLGGGPSRSRRRREASEDSMLLRELDCAARAETAETHANWATWPTNQTRAAHHGTA